MSTDNFALYLANEAEAYSLIGRIITKWSNIHEYIHGEIQSIRTLIYVWQSRAWRAAHEGGSHFGHVHQPRDIPDSRFKLRFRYYSRAVNALNRNDSKVKRQLEQISPDISRLYEIRNQLAHSEMSTSAYWEEPHITLRSRSWMDDWDKARERDPQKFPRFPKLTIKMTHDELRTALKDMDAILTALHNLPRPFDEPGDPPLQPKRPS